MTPGTSQRDVAAHFCSLSSYDRKLLLGLRAWDGRGEMEYAARTYPASFLNLALKVEYYAFRDADVRDFRMMQWRPAADESIQI